MEFLGIFLIILLVFANGFFVAAEFSIVSIRPTRIEELIKDNRPLAMFAKKALLKLNDMLSVCQLGITISSLLLGWLGEMYLAGMIETLLTFFHYTASQITIHGIAISIAFSTITVLHIILGELLPKTLAIQNTEQVVLAVSLPLYGFYFIFFPITYLLNQSTLGILKLFKIKPSDHKFIHSAEEIRILLEEQNKNGSIDGGEFQMIQNTIEFSEREAKDVMTHRLSIVGISRDNNIMEILKLIKEHQFSRYPVYEETTDKIVGVIHVQSFLEWMANPKRNKKAKVTSIMQSPVFVPASLSIQKVLSKLRSTNQHMAIVIDEYGGVAGILTMEDIIEEIFGQIRDETDVHEHEQVSKKGIKGFIINGETEVDELEDVLKGIKEEDLEEVRTISGFILERLGDMPKVGTNIEIPSGKLTVHKMEGNKIVTIQYHPAKIVTPPPSNA